MINNWKKYFEYRPILKKWIITGLVTVVVAGLIMVLSAVFMVCKLYQKEESLQEQILDENCTTLNAVFNEVVLGAQTLLSSNDVRAAIVRGDETVEDRMRISDINWTINEYMAVHSSFDEVYIFFPSLNPMGVLTKSEYLKVEEDTPYVSELSLQADYNRGLFSGKTYSKFKIAGSENDRQLYYSMSTSYADEFDDQQAVLLIKLKKTYMQAALSDNASFLIMTEDGSYIQLGDENFPDEFIEKCLTVQGREKVEDRIVYKTNKNQFGLNVVAVLESGSIEETMRPFVLGVILFCVTMFIASTYAIISLMRRHYRPIEHLLKFMDERSVLNNSFGENTDEFKRIEDSILRTANEISLSKEEMEKFKNNMENRLVSLLNYGHEPTMEEDINDEKYVVVSYDIDNPTGEPFEQIDRDQVWFIIHNVSEELIGSDNLLVTGGLAHWFYNIVKVGGENAITLDELSKELNTVCSFIREKFEIALVANVSDVHQGKKEIPDANRESMIVREYRIYVGALRNVAYYKELSLDDDAKETLSSYDKMEQVQNMYRLHRPDEASVILNSIVNDAIENAEGQKAIAIEPDKTGKTAALVTKAKGLVDTKYSDKDMNVNSIADELGVNNSYLSRSFKQVLNIGMLEYINKVRLENAEALMTAGVTVKDAADRVGFSTPRPLIRCFREKYGTTPGEYYKGK
ncbi:MAG: helix-turn-helix transcriptional regulator [Butyrivibrio sp.]|nr:helix-turn-helix transcriptional regulator [Butyrivibrio sp.]